MCYLPSLVEVSTQLLCSASSLSHLVILGCFGAAVELRALRGLCVRPAADPFSHAGLLSCSVVSSHRPKAFVLPFHLLPFFPLQAENTQAAQPEESRSEGRIGLKAYKNYFSAGASWFFIIFLLLLNMVGQVHSETCALMHGFTVGCAVWQGAAGVWLTRVENCIEEKKWGYLVRA